jgi:oxygen-independent coproporphyrinogen-3 oxidase
VSNWALPGFECVHNLGYWDGRPYLGLGAGAHSYRDGRRWWNVRPPQHYLQEVESGRLPEAGHEVLTGDQTRMERALLRLRTNIGAPTDWFDHSAMEPFVREGLAVNGDGLLRLTDRGMLLANEIVLSLVP